jgi:hypothetical protein
MSSLIGKPFLNSHFTQNANPNYIQINGVILGNNSQDNYECRYSNDINALMIYCSSTNNIVAVAYNSTTKLAYFKTQFNLNVPNDSLVDAEHITYIITNRITQANINFYNNDIIYQ